MKDLGDGSFEIPISNCPDCGYSLDATTSAYGEHTPRANDVSMCLNCGGLTLFTEDLRLRKPTPEEAIKINAMPAVIKAQIARIGIVTKDLTKMNSKPIVKDAGPKGKGTFATQSYGVGDLVMVRKNYMSLRYVNHSCDPNCHVQDPNIVVAIKPINIGAEITVDYEKLKFERIKEVFGCQCNSEQCRKQIK